LYGDYGILATPSGQAWGDSSYYDGYPTYYAMKLLSNFARGGDSIVQASSNNALLPVYAAKRADGSLSLLVINKDPGSTYTGSISLTSFVPLPNATVYSYGIPQDTAAQTGSGSKDIASSSIGNAAPAFSISVAPYSAVVIALQPAPLIPTISSQPAASQTVTSGQNVSFSVTAASNPAPTYQWQREIAGTSTWINLTDSGTYSGSLTGTLTVSSVASAMNGDAFRCVLTNSNGTATTTQANLVVESPFAVLTFAGHAGVVGHADGTGSAALFNAPADIALDGSGNAYLADANNSTVRMITPAGVVTTLAGQFGVTGSTDGSGSALFNHPAGIAVDGSGNAFIADTGNNTIRKLVISTGAVSTLAGQAGVAGSADGTGTAAGFSGPSGIAVDSTGNLYVSDTLNHTVRRITSAGAVTTIAGTAGASGFTDATGSAVRFHGPQGLALDASGDLFVADTNNNAVRKLVIATGAVTTVAGQSGLAGSADGANGVAQFRFPSGVAVDPSGNLYVADTDNHTLREIATTGAVSTLAGLAGTSGSADGVGTAARFNFPTGVAVHVNAGIPVVGTLPGGTNSTDIYIADTTNDTVRLAITPSTPAITAQPQSQTVTAGSGASFSVVVTASPAPTYQWFFNGSAISGATGSSYSLASAQSSNAGNYTVTITNLVGSVTSNQAMLTVNSVTPPPSGGGGGGGGGGGAPSLWFCGGLSLLALARRMLRRK
jgi:sugar lactone lactonase YvrE